jgi:S1-C subfamily serine protease
MYKKFVIACLLVLGSALQAVAQEAMFSDQVITRLAEVLSTRKFDNSAIQTRGRSDTFAKAVSAVPFVISAAGSGSSVVIEAGKSDAPGLVITNEHVVRRPFRNERGEPFVLLLFYDSQLVSEPFSRDRVGSCPRLREPTGWCAAFQRSIRSATVAGIDTARDLALLVVPKAPMGLSEIPGGQIDSVRAGDEVVVVGHPLELLWSLTTGIVSAVRHQFPTGTPPRVVRSTVIQTQAPVNPGNSGGPLLTAEGQLIGVIFGQGVGGRIQMPSQERPGGELTIPAAGLNFAIGINEVQGFISELTRKNRK